MALPDTHPIQVGTPIILGNSATHSPTGNNDLGADTDQIDLTSLAAGAARQSAKFDFGADRAEGYNMKAAFEFASGVVAGEVVELYLAFSHSATAGVGNPGGVSGSDSAYTGTAGSTLAESVVQLYQVGEFVCTDDATGTVQVATIGKFEALERYASLVVKDETTAAFHSDVIETSISMTPIVKATVDV